MRPNASEFVLRFTATPRGLLNWSSELLSLLMSVQPTGADLVTVISNDDAPPRENECAPLLSGPRSRLLAPPLKTTVTLSAASLRINETVPALLVTPDA